MSFCYFWPKPPRDWPVTGQYFKLNLLIMITFQPVVACCRLLGTHTARARKNVISLGEGEKRKARKVGAIANSIYQSRVRRRK